MESQLTSATTSVNEKTSQIKNNVEDFDHSNVPLPETVYRDSSGVVLGIIKAIPGALKKLYKNIKYFFM